MLTSISLAGTWDFALDPDGRGEREGWSAGALPDTIALPGSIDEAQKTPLTTGRTMAHLSRRHPYVGRAWYARDVEIGADAAALYQTLVLERPHGEVTAWLDGGRIGRDESLSTACRFFLGRLAEGTHRLVLQVDNGRFEAVGDAIAERNPDVAHSKTEHTQTNWNGIVGRLALEGSLAAIATVEVPRRDGTSVSTSSSTPSIPTFTGPVTGASRMAMRWT